METTTAPITKYSTRIDGNGAALADDALVSQWSVLVEQDQINDPQYATPQWAAHQQQTGKPVTTVSLFGSDGSLAGLSSLRQGTCSLPFNVQRKTLCKRVFQAEHVMGMLLPDDDLACDRLLAAIRHGGIGSSACLYFESIWAGSKLWSYLQRSEEVRRNWIRYGPNPLSKSHYIELPASFEAYLKKFSSKSRQHLKREVRSLRERGDGNLELTRVETAEQVATFLELARKISHKSWQKILLDVPIANHQADTGQRLLCAMARQGWLRSYLLKCGPDPCAFGIGYQMRGEYHFCETAYDEAFVKCGPGKTLVYLMLEDLIGSNKPATFHFGQGDMPYKDWFSNASKDEMNILLFRKTLRHRAWCGTHALYNGLVRQVRDAARWAWRPKARRK